jgi:hypothetical protein
LFVVVVASNGSASKNYYSYSYRPIIQVLKKINILPIIACKTKRIAYIYYSNYKKDCYGTL